MPDAIFSVTHSNFYMGLAKKLTGLKALGLCDRRNSLGGCAMACVRYHFAKVIDCCIFGTVFKKFPR